MSLRTKLWNLMTAIYPWWLRHRFKIDIGDNCVIAIGSRFDQNVNPQGIHIGNNVWILKGAVIFAHDYCRRVKKDVIIEDNCIIGINAIIMPGVHLGSHTIVGAGAVVTKSTSGHCIIAGNPARVIRENITIDNHGQIIE